MRTQRGNTLVLTTLFTTVLFGFSALAVDVGMNTFTRTHIQSVADSAALAGGKSIPVSQDLARTHAKAFAQRNGFSLSDGDISFPDPSTIKIQWTQPLDGLFARVLGIQQFQVPVESTAQLSPLGGMVGLRPWGIPMQDFAAYAPNTVHTIKMTPADQGYTGGGNFYGLALDKNGAREYRDNITYGASTEYEVGDTVKTEPGDVVGPTAQGIADLVGNDPHTSYQDALADGESNCPRIVTVVLMEPGSLQNGRDKVQIAGFGSFFLTDWGSNADVKAQFIHYAANGKGGGTPIAGGTQTLVLVD